MRNISTHELANVSVPASTSSDEQKLIDSARDILMRQRNLNPEEAYALLAEMAEKRKVGLSDIAAQLLTISKMLTI